MALFTVADNELGLILSGMLCSSAFSFHLSNQGVNACKPECK